MKEFDYRVTTDISGISLCESALQAGPIDKKSIKKRIVDGVPRYTLGMTGTTLGKTSINGLDISEDEADLMLEQHSVKERLNRNAFYCEMNHPFTTDVKRLRNIDQNNLSHRILEFYKTRGEYTSLCFLMETTAQQAGRNLAYMIEDDASIAVSLRAYAAATRINGRVAKLINATSYDAVWIPSNRESWSDRPSVASVQVMESINTDLARAMGVSINDIVDIKMNSLLHLEETNKKNVKRIELLESYMNDGRGIRMIDLNSAKNDIQESIMNISESAGINFDGCESEYIIINEAADTVLFASATRTIESKLSESIQNDIKKDMRSKLFSFRG